MSAPRHLPNELSPPQPLSMGASTPRRSRRGVWIWVILISVVAAVGLLATVVGTSTFGASAAPGGAESVAPTASVGSSTPTASPDDPARSADTTGTEGTALASVAKLTVKGRASMTGYERSAYGDGWSSTDGCSTREVILRRDLDVVTVAWAGDCAVVAGTLRDPYTGTTERLSASSLRTVEIDHVVALGDSWQKGAQQWDPAKRVRFANDPLNLLVTTGSVNAIKGDGDTATWLPPNKSFRCAYVARQVSVKISYGVWVTAAEKDAMTRVLSSCPNEQLITAEQARQQRDPHPAVSDPTGSAAPTGTRPSGTSAPTTDPRYPTCAAANRAGLGPYRRGVDPEYEWYRDGDGDGIVCER